MKCPNCNAELDDNSKFCSECGAKIPPQKKTNGLGVSIGDKNVISGGVSITNVNAQDETKLVNECHVCGKHVTNDLGHTCPECGLFTCNECFDKKEKMCDSCVKAKHRKALKRYQNLASEIYGKGVISPADRKVLEKEAISSGLSNEDIIAVENEYKKDSIGLTDADKIELEQCQKNLLEGKYNETKKIEAIYNEHSDNPDVLACYIRSIARSDDYDNDEVEKWINQLEYDNKVAQMTLVEFSLMKEDFSRANQQIEIAKKKWPNDYLVLCYEIILYCLFVNKKQRFEYLPKIHEILNNLGDSTNVFEESCGKFTKYLCGWIEKWKNSEDEEACNDDFDTYWDKLWIVDYSQNLKIQLENERVLDDVFQEQEKCEQALSSAGFSFGKFTDVRDENKYRTITIGSQTWMLESLRYAEKTGLCSLGQGVNDNKDFQNPDFGNNTYTWAAMMKKNSDKFSLPYINRIVNAISAFVLLIVIGKILSFFSDFESIGDYILYFLLSIVLISLVTFFWYDGYSHLGLIGDNKDNNGKEIKDTGKLIFALGNLSIEILTVIIAFKFNENFWVIWLLASFLISGIAFATSFWAFGVQSIISKENRNSVAPEGWRIPTQKDLNELCEYINQLFKKKQQKIKKQYSSELELLAKALSNELCNFERFWIANYLPLFPNYIFNCCKSIGKIDYSVDEYGITEFGIFTPYTKPNYLRIRNNREQKDYKCRIICIKK